MQKPERQHEDEKVQGGETKVDMLSDEELESLAGGTRLTTQPCSNRDSGCSTLTN
jgi:hypothetical protein